MSKGKRSSPLHSADAPFRRLGSVLRHVPDSTHGSSTVRLFLPLPGAPVRDSRPFRAPASRYRLLIKIQLTAPGRCRNTGLRRNYLAEGDCSTGVVSVVLPSYVSVWGFDLDEYQVYAQFILLDAVTGYKSQRHDYATTLAAT